MTYLYHALVVILAVLLVDYVVRERAFWKKAAAALVMIIFVLRAFLIQ